MPSPRRNFKTSRTIVALLLREMQASHGRSALGYFWAVAEPVAGILLLTFLFSLAFRSPPMGNSFAMFYASGFLPFMAYFDISQKVGSAIRFSRPLLFYPGVTFLDAIAARFVLSAITQVMVFALVMAVMVPALGIEAIFDFPAIGLSLLMAAALALAIGTLNCFLFERFAFWERLWAIGNRPMLIISAVVFVFDSVPQPYRDWLWWNPLIHVVGQMRIGFYSTYEGSYVSPFYVFLLSGLCLAAGLLLLLRHHRDLINA